MYYKKHPNGFLTKNYLIACLALLFSLASMFAVATEVDKSEASDSVEIIAQGVGIDADSALRNAYSNAIQQALGLYVDAETLVKNDQIVKDQVLTHSRGLIKEVTTVSESQEQGLAYVTIRATVLRQPLLDRVRPVLESTVPIDGRSLHAAIASKEEQAQDAQALLSAAIEKIVGPHLFNFEIDGELQVDEDNQDRLIVPVKITPNFEVYDQLRDEFVSVLDQISTEKQEFNFLQEDKFLTASGYARYTWLRELETVLLKRHPLKSKEIIAVQLWQSQDAIQSKWSVYHIPVESKPPKVAVAIEIQLLDNKGQILALGEKRIDPRWYGLGRNGKDSTYFFAPNYFHYSSRHRTGFFLFPLSENLHVLVSIPAEKSVLADVQEMNMNVKHRLVEQ